jgi:ATP-binding cassette, subfamily B, bacterial
LAHPTEAGETDKCYKGSEIGLFSALYVEPNRTKDGMQSRDSKPAHFLNKATWRERAALFRKLATLLGLVWKVNPPCLAVIIVLRILRSILPLATLWVWKLVLDAAVGLITHNTGDVVHIWRLVALEFALTALGDILGRTTHFLTAILRDRFNNTLGARFILHAKELDLASFENPSFQDTVERARRPSIGRLTFLTSSLNICQNTLSLVLLSIGLVSFSPWLVLLLVASVIPMFAGETLFAREAYAIHHHRTPERRYLDYLRYLGSSPQSAKEVKLLGIGAYLAARYRAAAAVIEAEHRRFALRRTVVGWSLETISTASYYGVYVLILGKLLAGGTTIGAFTFLTRAFSRCRTYLDHIVSDSNELIEDAIFIRDLFAFLEMRPAVCSPLNGVSPPRPIRYGFEFQNVSFAYPGSERWALREINIHLRPGEKIGVIGQNGAGKTTFVKLLTRLYDPTEGRILLDGIDLREYNLDQLRRNISVMFQDFMRYDMTVRDNIGLGDIDSMQDEARLAWAAHKGLCEKLIDRLPSHYDQVVGKRFEGGSALSRGEWQRLALARAYMPDAQVLILDEPAASLDARAEHQLFLRLNEDSNNRLAIVISHKFSSVRMADRIIVFAEGAIREQGSHQYLISTGGHYAALFELQAKAYR